jgi:hypothetical protein
MLHVDAGNDRVGVGTNAPARTVQIVDSSATPYLSIVGPNNASAGIMLGDTDDETVGRITYDNSDNGMQFWTNDTERFRVHGDGTLSTGGETVTDVNIGGLTLQMNANDGGFFSVKSSDIAHGITGTAETDTFVKFSKHSATNGGISIIGLTEATECIKLNANPTSAVTDQNGSSVGAHIMSVSKKSGSGTGSFDSTGNILSISNHTATRFHFRGDGNFYADAGSNTFDEFEDAHLVRAYDLSHGKGVINSKFDEYVKYNHEKLAELDLVGRENNGEPNHFINVTGFQKLHNGAIWQQYEKHQN